MQIYPFKDRDNLAAIVRRAEQAGSEAIVLTTDASVFGNREWDRRNYRAPMKLTARNLWPRKLLVKGVLLPEDAVRAQEAGADGVVVSNHGGRQLDNAPAPIETLAAVRAAVGAEMTVIVDSGFRRGSDF